MRKNSVVVVLVFVVLLLVVGAAGAVEICRGRIAADFMLEEFFTVEKGWFHFDVTERGVGGTVEGIVRWREYDAEQGYRFVKAHPVCVNFGDCAGEKAATLVVQVDEIRGWRDPAEFEGELMKFWLTDEGVPGKNGDALSTLGPWPPTDDLEDYGCDYEDPEFSFPVVRGDISIVKELHEEQVGGTAVLPVNR